MLKERIVLFGAGMIGSFCAKMFRFDKEIICFCDNDCKKIECENIPVYLPEKLNDIEYSRIIISILDYPKVVRQLEEMNIHNYVYYEDVYSWQLKCQSREILDRYILEYAKGQYLGQFVKNSWMNHLINRYSRQIYKRFMPEKGKILDVGCGCGTQLFHWLLMGYDAYGLDCCQWKLNFCHQKIEDFNFPSDWKDRFILGYGEDLPYEDNEFDLLTSWMVLEHVADVGKCIKEMIRVLKHNGVLFLNAPDYRNSYEEHYGIDIGMPIVDNADVLRDVLVSKHESLDVFDELNFITKPKILNEFKKLCKYNQLRIIDLEEDSPLVVRENGQLKYRNKIQLIVVKL